MILVGALLAASTGIVGATVVTMGVLSLPTMIDKGYHKGFASGIIASSGTLGQIIPPSIVLVLLGDMMNVDVGDLFTGAFIPGMILVGGYMTYVLVVSLVRPELCGRPEEDTETVQLKSLLTSFIAPLVLMSIVLGTILLGLASPTEAASCGAVGAMATAGLRKRLNSKLLFDTAKESAQTSAMVFMILIGAQFFGVVFRGLGGDEAIQSIVGGMNASPQLVLISLMALLFVLGFFLDF